MNRKVTVLFESCVGGVFFFFLRMIVTRPTVGTAARLWSGQADNSLFLPYETQALMFPTQSVCFGTAKKIYLGVISSVEVTKQTAKSTKHQSWLEVLTEGVSFSSDLSLSPCSKNSLVTNSATWGERKDHCRAYYY